MKDKLRSDITDPSKVTRGRIYKRVPAHRKRSSRRMKPKMR